MFDEDDKLMFKGLNILLGTLVFWVVIFLILLTLFASKDCEAQSINYIQEINRQQHQQEIMRQNQQILQQQYIQAQQLDQIRRDAEFRFNHNQSNRIHSIHNHNNLIRY